jgi:hypothetical protein
MSEEIRRLKYCGDQDLTVWLENANLSNPVIFPYWPRDYPTTVPVFLDGKSGVLAVAMTRRAMLDARGPSRLWFCSLELGELLANTDADASWFEGG